MPFEWNHIPPDKIPATISVVSVKEIIFEAKARLIGAALKIQITWPADYFPTNG